MTEKSGTLQNIRNLLSYTKRVKEILMFNDIEIEKKKITVIWLLFFWGGDVDVEKVLVCSKVSFGEKN